MRRIRSTLLACAVALPLASCSLQPRLSASSADELSESLDRYVSAANFSSVKERKAAVATLKSIYFTDDAFKAKLPPGVPAAKTVLGELRYDEVVTVAARLDKWAKGEPVAVTTVLPEESATERLWRNKFLIEQLNAQIAILDAKRENARYKDLFTVDQFQVTESSYIPPQHGVPLGQDQATFVATFDNTSMFGVHSVGFHVRIKDPESPSALLDEVLVYSAAKDPILAGETRQIMVTCCDSFTNERLNRAMRDLPLNAEIDMTLAEVTDFTKKNRLEGASFSAAESLRLFASKACLQDIQSRLPLWSPSNAVMACDKY